jgi:sortase B
LISVVFLTYILLGYKTESDRYQKLRDKYVAEDAQENKDSAGTDRQDDEAWYSAVTPDLEGLREVNGDVIGWLHFDNNEYIDYPILYSGEDDTYLHTDIYGNESKSGCIFLEGNNTPDFMDCHSILYGHNMKDLSMFGSLKKYKTEDYYQENQYFTVYLDGTALRYQIFAYYDVDETDSVYTVGFAPDDQFAQFVSEMYRKSYEDTGVEATKDDKILTLSTCSTTGKRFVVHAVCVAQHSYGQ